VNIQSTIGDSIIPRHGTSGAANILLPVQIHSFTADIHNCAVDLTWVTAEENNFSTYEIQYCTDGKSYQTIGSVPVGQINSIYSFHHANPAPGKIYYRLKMVNVDGNFEYSKVLAENLICNSELSTFPNPVIGFISFNVSLGKTNDAIAMLFDGMGNMVYSAKVSNGTNTISMNKFSSGIYLLLVKKKDSPVQVTKVLK
jgi:hypothetical protein